MAPNDPNKPSVEEKIKTIRQEVEAWPGVITRPHRFGGTEFRLGQKEFGHIHYRGLMDILFNNSIREQLLREKKISPHHLYPDSGWTSFYVKDRTTEEAVWLLRLSYLFQARRQRADQQLGIDLGQTLADLGASPALRLLLAA